MTFSEPSPHAQAREIGGSRAVELVDDFVAARCDRRGFLQRAAAIGLSATTAGGLLAACGSSSSGNQVGPKGGATQSAAGKTLLWRPLADVGNLDPSNADPEVDDPLYQSMVFEGLISDHPETGAQVLCLAETFEQSKDGLQLHFTLKPGIPWQKGYGEVTAADVKFSYERIAGLTKPKLKSPAQADWAQLESVRVHGKYSGTIILKEIFAPIMTSTLRGGSGLVVPEKAVQKLGKHFGTKPVGSGPYEWVSWVPGQKLVTRKFAQYGGANKAYANKNLFGEIDALPIQSDETAYSALETGAVNLCELGTSTVANALKNPNIKVTSLFAGTYYWLAMNVTQPPLTNIWLRRAIRSAVDVPSIIKGAYQGLFTRQNSILPKTMPIGYWANAPEYNRNVTLAKSYLRRSGLKNVSLTLSVGNVQSDVAACEIIASNLESVGIKVHLNPVDNATFSDIPGKGGGGPHAQLVYSFYAGALDPNVWFEWWTKAQIGLWNWDHWASPRFDDLLNQALKTYNVAERTRLYIEAQQLWNQEAGMVWVGGANSYIGTAPNIKLSIDPTAGHFLPWNTTYA